MRSFGRFLVSFMRMKKLLTKVDAMREQHSRAVDDLKDALNGNGNGKRRFQPRKMRRVAKEVKADLGMLVK